MREILFRGKRTDTGKWEERKAGLRFALHLLLLNY